MGKSRKLDIGNGAAILAESWEEEKPEPEGRNGTFPAEGKTGAGTFAGSLRPARAG
jgi:hypothetical protein